jgi:hypothetical protein
MIRKLFEQTKPQFISVNNGQFRLKDAHYGSLSVFIKDILPVRKRFAGNKLVCFARDGTTAGNGQVCGFCRERDRCQQRLRLNLMVNNADADPVPAVLEIRAHLFEALDEAIAKADEGELADVLFELTVADGPGVQIRFTPAF